MPSAYCSLPSRAEINKMPGDVTHASTLYSAQSDFFALSERQIPLGRCIASRCQRRWWHPSSLPKPAYADGGRDVCTSGSVLALQALGDQGPKPPLVLTSSDARPPVGAQPSRRARSDVRFLVVIPAHFFEVLRRPLEFTQYASRVYQQELRTMNAVTSMSRKGNCWDNAVVESFFGTLKRELLNGRVFESRPQARSEVFEYIEVFFNR